MSKRLQVILQDPEYREVQRAARLRHMSIAQWVRQALLLARGQEPSSTIAQKLDAIRCAVRYSYPAGNVDDMLAEIERGYLGKRP